MSVIFDGEKYYIDESIVIYKPTRASDARPHTHSFIEAVYVSKGSCVHIIDSIEYPASRGDMILINYAEEHEMRISDGCEYINILIKPEFFNLAIKNSENAFSLLTLQGFEEFADTVDRENRLLRFSGGERTRLEMLLYMFIDEQDTHHRGVSLMQRSIVNMLFIMLFRKMELPIGQGFSGIDSTFLDYIRNNCDKRLTVAHLADTLGYTPSYFSRLFKSVVGKTCTEYITDCRVKKACDLLTSTDMSVETVMIDCGFADRTSFFKHFNEIVGMSPKKYQKSKKSILF